MITVRSSRQPQRGSVVDVAVPVPHTALLTAGRLVARVVVVAGILAGASVAVSPDGALPAAVANLVGSCAEAAPGSINVAIAVDPGVLPGSPRGPEVMCVTVPDGANGADVLVERARLLGRPPPRWAPSGLMCAIDGYPATGCGERVDGAYRYWSYHLGDEGSWNYARTGPAMRRATASRMEGWHFIAGANSPADPPPRVAPSSLAVCPSPPPPAAAPIMDSGMPSGGGLSAPAAPPPPAATPPGPGSPGNVAPDAGGVAPSSGSGGAQTPDSAAGSANGDSGGPVPDGDAIGSVGPESGAEESSSPTPPAGDGTMAAGRGPAMARAAGSDPSGSAGVPLAVVVMVVAVAGLGIGATVRSRRRSHL